MTFTVGRARSTCRVQLLPAVVVLVGCLVATGCAFGEPASTLGDTRAAGLPLNLQRDDHLNNLLGTLMLQNAMANSRSFGRAGNYMGGADGFGASFSSGGGPSKRQLRYHQCYFNPVSCFRRK